MLSRVHEKAPPIAKVWLSAACQLRSPGPLLQSTRSDGLEYIAKLQQVVLYIYAGCIQAPIGSQSTAHQHAKTRQPVMTCHLETGEVDMSRQAVIFTWFKLTHHDRPSSSPGSGWHVRTDCHLTWFKLMHHDRLSTCTGWRWQPVLMHQLELSS